MDIRSKPKFVPRGHHLLFAFLLVCLLACLLAFLFSFLAMSIMLIYFMPLSYALRIFFFSLLVYWFLVFAFACTHMERERMELGHSLPSVSKKGEDASMSI